MQDYRTHPRVASLTNAIRNLGRWAVILVSVVLCYYLPEMVGLTSSAAELLALGVGPDWATGILEAIGSLNTPAIVGVAWKGLVLWIAAVRYLSVPDLLDRHWPSIRGFFIATGVVLIVPGAVSVLVTALTGGYADPTIPYGGPRASVWALVVDDFGEFGRDVYHFMPVLALAYFYTAFDADTLAGYRDVLVVTVGFSLALDTWLNTLDTLEDRFYSPGDYAWFAEGLIGEMVPELMGFPLVYGLYYGVAVLALLALADRLADSVDPQQLVGSGE